MTILSGVIDVTINGIVYAAEESCEYSTQKREYDAIIVSTGYGGQQGKGTAPYISVTIRLDETQTSDSVNIKNGEVIVRLEDRTLSMAKASYSGKLAADGAKNSVKCKFEGPSLVEVLS